MKRKFKNHIKADASFYMLFVFYFMDDEGLVGQIILSLALSLID